MLTNGLLFDTKKIVDQIKEKGSTSFKLAIMINEKADGFSFVRFSPDLSPSELSYNELKILRPMLKI